MGYAISVLYDKVNANGICTLYYIILYYIILYYIILYYIILYYTHTHTHTHTRGNAGALVFF